MSLRRPEPAEAEAITDLWHDGWRFAHLAITPDELIRHRTRVVFTRRLHKKWPNVLVTGPVGDPTGFAALIDDELDQFYLAGHARGTGLARTFMAAIEAEFAERDIRRPRLICTVGNDRAARFYAKAGWQNIGQRMGAVEIPGGTFELPVWEFRKTL